MSSLYLTAPDASPLPAAQPGQYLTLRIPEPGRPAPVRSYSLSSAPGAAGYRISVKHEPHGTVSGYLTGGVRAGAVLDVAAPRGDFVLGDGTDPVLLISAGIGVTPVLSMLHELAGRRSDREVWWIHGDRGPREHPLAGEARDLLASSRTPTSGCSGARRRRPNATVARAAPGRLTSAALAALGVPVGADAYVCGPAAFMTDVAQALTALGFDAARIHTELFGALPPMNPGVSRQDRPPAASAVGTGRNRAAGHLRPQRHLHPVRRRRERVLELADACDVPSRWSCRTGVCHTCVTPLLSGEISYDAGAARTARPTARYSSAAPSPTPTSSSTCDGVPHSIASWRRLVLATSSTRAAVAVEDAARRPQG